MGVILATRLASHFADAQGAALQGKYKAEAAARRLEDENRSLRAMLERMMRGPRPTSVLDKLIALQAADTASGLWRRTRRTASRGGSKGTTACTPGMLCTAKCCEKKKR